MHMLDGRVGALREPNEANETPLNDGGLVPSSVLIGVYLICTCFIPPNSQVHRIHHSHGYGRTIEGFRGKASPAA